jgi:hypothetical protein
MDAHTREMTLKACLKEMRERLEQATSIANAPVLSNRVCRVFDGRKCDFIIRK